MKKIINNKYNLMESQITEIVKRVKVLLLNSKQEILLGYAHFEYQFPGGHVEDGETLSEAVLREIKEEVGIDLDDQFFEPFACAINYYKNYPLDGKNRKNEIYYFKVFTDQEPIIEKTNYTDNEKDGNYELRYIKFDELEKELMRNAKEHGDIRGITKEMLLLLKYFNNTDL